jgi:hypothetical protein
MNFMNRFIRRVRIGRSQELSAALAVDMAARAGLVLCPRDRNSLADLAGLIESSNRHLNKAARPMNHMHSISLHFLLKWRRAVALNKFIVSGAGRRVLSTS